MLDGRGTRGGTLRFCPAFAVNTPSTDGIAEPYHQSTDYRSAASPKRAKTIHRCLVRAAHTTRDSILHLSAIHRSHTESQGYR